MKQIKQNLYSVEYGHNSCNRSTCIVADNIEEAFEIAKQVAADESKSFVVKTVRFIGNCYKNAVKTITIEV